jgi:2-desacetyl-2-hydroxyethyl bacteriochlorophyllide A dehydrogenase
MKAIVCTKPGQLDEIEIPEPEPIPGHSILKINRVNVCGTDLHAFEGTQPYFNYPRILGHEISGELVAIDNADGFSIGDQVTIIPYLNCGGCLACRSGKPNCCANIKVCGVHIDGAMSEYYAVPSYTLVHNQGIITASLAMVEPLAIGAHGIRRANVKAGDWVVVIGAGPIGLGTMEFAKIAGAQVIAVDINHQRLEFSRNHLGIQHTIDASHTDAFEQGRDITKGEMAAIVIDATGNQKAINAGLNYVGHGGTYVLIGLQKGDLIFSHPEFHKRETTLMSSRNATRTDFNQVINAIRQGQVDPNIYISKTVPFAAVTQEFGSWLHPSDNLVKVAINISA